MLGSFLINKIDHNLSGKQKDLWVDSIHCGSKLTDNVELTATGNTLLLKHRFIDRFIFTTYIIYRFRFWDSASPWDPIASALLNRIIATAKMCLLGWTIIDNAQTHVNVDSHKSRYRSPACHRWRFVARNVSSRLPLEHQPPKSVGVYIYCRLKTKTLDQRCDLQPPFVDRNPAHQLRPAYEFQAIVNLKVIEYLL